MYGGTTSTADDDSASTLLKRRTLADSDSAMALLQRRAIASQTFGHGVTEHHDVRSDWNDIREPMKSRSSSLVKPPKDVVTEGARWVV